MNDETKKLFKERIAKYGDELIVLLEQEAINRPKGNNIRIVSFAEEVERAINEEIQRVATTTGTATELNIKLRTLESLKKRLLDGGK